MVLYYQALMEYNYLRSKKVSEKVIVLEEALPNFVFIFDNITSENQKIV